MIDINLIPPKNLLSKKEKQNLKQLLMLTVALTAATLVVGGSILFASTTINGLVLAANFEKSNLTKSLNEKAAAVSQLKELNEKTVGIREIKNSSVDFGKIVGDLSAVMLPATKINSFNIDTMGNITTNLSSSNLNSFGLIVDKLSEEKNTTPFNHITVSGIKEIGETLNFSLVMKYDFSKQNEK